MSHRSLLVKANKGLDITHNTINTGKLNDDLTVMNGIYSVDGVLVSVLMKKTDNGQMYFYEPDINGVDFRELVSGKFIEMSGKDNLGFSTKLFANKKEQHNFRPRIPESFDNETAIDFIN
jgi:hypothetical protein